MSNIFIVFAPILYFVTLLIPFAVPGPIASLLFVSYVKKKKLSIMHLVLLLIADGLCFFIIYATPYLHSYGLVVCLTPIAVAVSWVILRSSWKTLMQIGEEDSEFQKRIDVGLFLIFFLQILILVIVGGIADRSDTY